MQRFPGPWQVLRTGLPHPTHHHPLPIFSAALATYAYKYNTLQFRHPPVSGRREGTFLPPNPDLDKEVALFFSLSRGGSGSPLPQLREELLRWRLSHLWDLFLWQGFHSSGTKAGLGKSPGANRSARERCRHLCGWPDPEEGTVGTSGQNGRQHAPPGHRTSSAA